MNKQIGGKTDGADMKKYIYSYKFYVERKKTMLFGNRNLESRFSFINFQMIGLLFFSEFKIWL